MVKLVEEAFRLEAAAIWSYSTKSMEFSGTPKDMGPPKMVSGTHTIPIRIPKDMGSLYGSRLPFSGVPCPWGSRGVITLDQVPNQTSFLKSLNSNEQSLVLIGGSSQWMVQWLITMVSI